MEDLAEKEVAGVGPGPVLDRYRAVFDSTADPVLVHELDGTIVDANRPACELLGMTKERLIGRDVKDLLAEGSVPDQARMEELLRSGHASIAVEINGRHGKRQALEVDMSLLAREDKIVVVGQAREPAARPSDDEARLLDLLDQMRIAAGRLDPDGTVREVNRCVSFLLGYSRDELVGRRYQEFLVPGTEDGQTDGLDLVLRGKIRQYMLERPVRKKGGRAIWVRATITAVRNGCSDEPVLMATMDNIDQDRRAEEALRLSQANYEAIVNDQTELVCRFTPDGTLTFANEAYCRYFRARQEELVGHTFLDGIAESDRDMIAGRIRSLTPEDPCATYEHAYVPLHQPPTWLQWTDRGMFDPDGRVREIHSVGTDVTDRLAAKNAQRESEERLLNVIEMTNDIVWEVDASSKFVFLTGKVKEILGYGPEELVGITLFDLLPAEEGKRAALFIAEASKNPRPMTTSDVEVKRKDGETVLLEMHFFPLLGKEGEVTGYRGVSRDITERKKAVDALRRSEERFRSLVQNSLDIIAVLSPGGVISYISPSSLRLLGYSPEEGLAGRNFLDLVHVEDIPSLRASLDRIIQDPQTTVAPQFRLRCRDGQWAVYEAVATNQLAEPSVGGLVINARDVTERKRSEEVLRRKDSILEAISLVSERLIRGASWSDNISDVLEVMGEATDADRAHIFEMLENENGSKQVYLRYEWTYPGTAGVKSNPDMNGFDLRKMGLSKWEDTLLIGGIVQASFSELHYPARSFLEAQNVRSTIAVPILAGYELWGYVSIDDIVRERQWSSTEIDAIRAVASTLGSAILRERATLDLEMEKERLAVTLRSIADGVITTDINGDIVLMNNAAEDMLGHFQAEVEGQPVRRIIRMVKEERGRDENPVYRVLKSGERVDMDSHIITGRYQRSIVIEDSAAPIRDRAGKVIGAVLVIRDVTNRKAMEDELVKSQRLESVGILAGGIAHDFNNIMTAILGNIALAKAWCRPGDKVLDKLKETEKATLRARDLTQQLLTFSKGGAPIKRTARIADVLHDTVDFSLSGSNVRAEYDVPEDIWTVNIDSGQISQVLDNLIANAKDAMPDGGMLDLRVRNIEAPAADHASLRPGRYVELTLTDHGTGIPKENLDKIFEPYFTTKSKGTGLGLAVVYSVIAKHEGHIDVESEVGTGTTFHIYLPATEDSPQVEAEAREAVVMGKGKVLLMDDEELILEVTGEILRSLGYEVELSQNGEECVEKYTAALKEGGGFDAVIVDLTIPGGMGGKEALVKLREIDPNVKVIVSSGYSSDATMADYRRFGFSGVIPKPYKIEDLSKVMREVISAGPAPEKDPGPQS